MGTKVDARILHRGKVKIIRRRKEVPVRQQAPGEVDAKGVRDAPESCVWFPAGGSLPRCRVGLRINGRLKRQRRRNSFHTASPAVELTLVILSFERLVTGSGSQYTQWPWALARRALISPCRRRLLIATR